MMYFFLTALCFISLYFWLVSVALLVNRFKWRRFVTVVKKRLLRLMQISMAHVGEKRRALYKQWLTASGLRIDAALYLALRRGMLGIVGLSGLTLALVAKFLPAVKPSTLLLGLFFTMGLWAVCLFDKTLFQMMARKRRKKIVQDVYVISQQLLYYQSSKMNLHSKLQRCLPHTTALRHHLEMLSREWYEGADVALERFKVRVGAEEAYSFAETLNSLRLQNDERYYELLRQRIQDYKQKIELQNESKKEAKSYVLFLLAGLPIMNTFRVFIYPWVQEGQKLFESLH